MILFNDGRTSIKSVIALMQDYYLAFCEQYGEISYSKWQGSSEYELAYISAQRDHQNAIIFNESLSRALNSIQIINSEISRPSCLISRIVDTFKTELLLSASVRPMTLETGGTLAICVDTKAIEDENEGILPLETARAIGLLIKDRILTGGIWMDGDQSFDFAMSNGQSVKIKWYSARDNVLPCKLAITRSRNSNAPILPVPEIIKIFQSNFSRRWRLGCDFTPGAYIELSDLPFAGSVNLSFSTDGTNYRTDIYQVDFNHIIKPELLPVDVEIS